MSRAIDGTKRKNRRVKILKLQKVSEDAAEQTTEQQKTVS